MDIVTLLNKIRYFDGVLKHLGGKSVKAFVKFNESAVIDEDEESSDEDGSDSALSSKESNDSDSSEQSDHDANPKPGPKLSKQIRHIFTNSLIKSMTADDQIKQELSQNILEKKTSQPSVLTVGTLED